MSLGEWQRISESVQAHIYSELPNYRMSDFFPEDHLTTREYVRSEAIVIKPEYIDGPNINVLGFGGVVWSRICWSMDDNCSMDNTDNIHRGVLPGHRFDSIDLGRHKQAFSEGIE